MHNNSYSSSALPQTEINSFLNRLRLFQDNPLQYKEHQHKCNSYLQQLQTHQAKICQEKHHWISIKLINFCTNTILKQKCNSSSIIIAHNNKVKESNSVNIKNDCFLTKALSLEPNAQVVNYSIKDYLSEVKSICSFLYKYDKHLIKNDINEYILDITDYCEDNYASSKQEIGDILKEIIDLLQNTYKHYPLLSYANNKLLSLLALESFIHNSTQVHKEMKYIMYIENNVTIINSILHSICLDYLHPKFIFDKTYQKLKLMKVNYVKDIFSLATEVYYMFPNQYKTLFGIAYGLGETEHEHVRNIKPIVIKESLNCKTCDKVITVFDVLAKEVYNEMKKRGVHGKGLSVEIEEEIKGVRKRKERSCLLERHLFKSELEIRNNGRNLVRGIIDSSGNQNNKTYVKLTLKLNKLIINDKSEDKGIIVSIGNNSKNKQVNKIQNYFNKNISVQNGNKSKSRKIEIDKVDNHNNTENPNNKIERINKVDNNIKPINKMNNSIEVINKDNNNIEQTNKVENNIEKVDNKVENNKQIDNDGNSKKNTKVDCGKENIDKKSIEGKAKRKIKLPEPSKPKKRPRTKRICDIDSSKFLKLESFYQK